MSRDHLFTNSQSPQTMMKRLSVALIQFKVGADKTININRAANKISEVVHEENIDLVALPECFNSPYGIEHFAEFAENIPKGPTCQMLSEVARCSKVFIVGGTIPEREGNDIYNTCTVWNREGKLVAKYRKTHLFDINIPREMVFQESAVIKPGNNLSIFKVGEVSIGLGICYDLRFQELAFLYRKRGVDVIMYPGAFNMTTGPLHWELLQRARAVDNQVFVCGIAPANCKDSSYKSYGHTQITDPWGKTKQLEFDEGVLYSKFDFKQMKIVRQSIPVFEQRRVDMYETVEKGVPELID